MSDELDITLLEMTHEWPVRTAITSVCPLLFVGGQFANSYYNGISLVYPAVFAVLFLGMVVLTLQQQFAAFRSTRL